MNEWIESVQLGSALLKGSALLLATSLSAMLLRKASATNQYRVYFVGACMSLLVAVASVVAPFCNLDVPVEHGQVGRATTGAIARTTSVELTASHHDDFDTANLSLPPAKPSIDGLVGANQNLGTSQSTSVEQSRPHRAAFTSSTAPRDVEIASAIGMRQRLPSRLQGLLKWWPVVWGMGIAAIVLQTLLRNLALSKALNQCEKLQDQAPWRLSRELSQRHAVAPPELLVHAEAITPFIAGLGKPKVVLPSKSSTWSTQKLTFVLLHEMAHIKRRDLWTQLIARVVVAVYWFNPLSWWSFAQMMRLRELACDDWVLLQEKKPDRYAEILLDVASQCRSHGQAYGIGMSGKLDIARRIHSALDATRARTPFSRRTSLLGTGFALVLCLVLGALQLRSRAVEPQEETSSTGAEQKDTEPSRDLQAKEAVDEEARSMIIRILDEQSQPLAGVDVYVTGIDYERRGGNGNLPRIHYPTDASGETRIRFREGTLSLQLWPRKHGYVPQYVNLNEKKLTLPREYTFYFEKGTRLAGKITDPLGKPIEGASVQVKTDGRVELNERAQKSSPQARCSGWLGEDELAAKTNANGEWEIHNSPSAERNPELKVELLVDHPDFVGDSRWGDYQARQGITTEQLRNGSAILVMERGVVLRGKVTGPEGEPVTKGLVIWVSNPYFATGVNEVQIQSDGTYQLPNLEPGKYPITVLAPGFAPDQREIQLSQGAPTCDFQLEAGNPIRIEIVDAQGNPIPSATVSFGRAGWRGTTAIYNDKHSNVPDSGIPRRADEDGVFTWEWAPSDGVKYDIYKSGYDSKSVTLIAKAEAHRVVLTSPLTISGSIIDAKSGKPIPHFKVMPVKAFRPDFYSTDFQESRVATGENGEYQIQINSQGQSTDRYRVRVEADGYRTSLGTKSLAAGDPPLVEDFRLEPVAPLAGRVVTHDGKPANKFQVVIGTATTSPQFDFDRPDTFFGQAFEVEGENTFEIAASFESQRLRIFNEDGFAELLVQPEQDEIGQVILRPYAKLSGRLMQGDVPIGTEGVYFYPLLQRGLKEARFQDSFFTQTDPDGYFVFDRLPPIAGSVRAYLGPWRESNLTSSHSVPLDLKPGEHQQLLLSGSGISITGQVVASGRSNDEFSKQWSLNWLVSRQEGVSLPPEASPLSIPSNSGPIDSAWLRHTDFSAWLAARQNHYVKLRDDGFFTIHGVPAGEYDLVIQLFEQPAGCLVEAVGTRVIPVTVTSEQIDTGELNLGNLDVVCRSGPRQGADMRAYEFVNSEGRVVSVNDLSGRYLLFHVWASWCQPCLDSMPELRADIGGLKNASFTAIGFNVDADTELGRSLAGRLKLNWAQNYLGEDSDFARQLAISSVPAYYLIGPDGKLVGSSSAWQEIRKLLEENLGR